MFAVGDIDFVRNYGQGPKWIRGTVIDNSGPYNFLIEVNMLGQLMRWKRHTDQLRKCFDTSSNCDTR